MTLNALKSLRFVNFRLEAALLHPVFFSDNFFRQQALLSLRDVRKFRYFSDFFRLNNHLADWIYVRLERIPALLFFPKKFQILIHSFFVHDRKFPHAVFKSQILVLWVSLYDVLAHLVNLRLEPRLLVY